MKFIKNLLFMFSIFALLPLCAADNAKPQSQEEQKKEAQGEVLVGKLWATAQCKTLGQLLKQVPGNSVGNTIKNDTDTIMSVYHVTNKDVPLINVNYTSEETNNRCWVSSIHPKLVLKDAEGKLNEDHFQIRAQWLPLLVPIAYKINTSAVKEMIQRSEIPVSVYDGVCTIIAQYAPAKDRSTKFTLNQCKHGDIIEIQLPISTINKSAQLTCGTRFEDDNFVEKIRAALLQNKANLSQDIINRIKPDFPGIDETTSATK